MSQARVLALTLLALLAFAGNSLLCRMALRETRIDPASFTTLRLVSGALALWLIVRMRGAAASSAGNAYSAFALFAYAICFSLAYVQLSAGTGALLLFGAVQATMIGWGLYGGERLRALQLGGLLLAAAGLIGLLLPGLSAPPLAAATLMLAAGAAWGVYSLRGRASNATPLSTTARNFALSVPFAFAALGVSGWSSALSLDGRGLAYALASGIVTSALGYAVWYTALQGLSRTQAATVQLSVPIIAAFGGVLLLGEPVTWRLLLCAAAILGGIALVIVAPARTAVSTR